MVRISEKKRLLTATPGTERFVMVHKYGSENSAAGRVYIQASLHADEYPAMLVANHLIKLLDDADKRGEIKKEIVVVPYANPIGLSQFLFNTHLGRFSFDSTTNFNREWKNFTSSVWDQVKEKLTPSVGENTSTIRAAITQVLGSIIPETEEASLKLALLQESAISDVVMDLHCDSNALMHFYTHDRLWPELEDLAKELGSGCQLLDADSGGVCFDESNMNPWASFQDMAAALPHKPPVEMACQACTVELRGQNDVFDDLALKDATGLFRFLARRGYVSPLPESSLMVEKPELLREPSPLVGVDMIKAAATGVVAWKVRVGDEIVANQLVGEIVDVADVDAPRVPVISRTAGVMFAWHNQRLVKPGDIVAKVAGREPLPWRVGNLLTAK